METERRKSGYYRVNYAGVWLIAQWSALYKCWWLTQTGKRYYERDFDEINETRIEANPY